MEKGTPVLKKILHSLRALVVRTEGDVTHGHKYSKSMDQPGKVASPARGQLDRENKHFPVPVRA